MKSIVLTSPQVEVIFEHAGKRNFRDDMLVRMSYYCAMTPSELVHSRVEAFDRESGKMRIASGAKMFGSWQSHEPIQLPHEIIALMRAFTTNIELGWFFPSGPTGCSVVGCPGGHLTSRMVQHVFAETLKSARISHCGINSLRHTRLTEIGERTKNPALIQELGRISSMKICRAYAGVYKKRAPKGAKKESKAIKVD